MLLMGRFGSLRHPSFEPREAAATPTCAGDSLLFATGALAALGSLNLAALMGTYVAAAILGDAVN